MAATTIGTSHSIAQKIYRPGLIVQAERHWIHQLLIGKSEDSAIVLQEEPSRTAGDTVQIRFSPTVEQAGFHEDDTIEGNEAALTFDFQEFKIGYKAWAFAQRNPMSQQRVNIDIEKAAQQKLPILVKRYFERAIFAQLGGATYLNSATGLTNIRAIDSEYNKLVIASDNLTGMNATAALDTSHIVYASGTAAHTTANAVGADSTATMSLALVDDLVEKAETQRGMDYPVAPTSLGYYILAMSIEQGRQLRAATSSGDWADLQRALLEGGKDWMTSEFARAGFGIYNKTILCTSDYLPRGRDSADVPEANTRVALFLGAKAGVIGYGQGYTDGQHLDWTTQIRDYKVKGVSVDTVWGCKRTQFKNLSDTLQTFGLLGLVTYVKQ